MKFMDKELDKIVVTLPLADGTEMDCGVFASFEVQGIDYMALLPLKEDGTLDETKSYMLYRVDEDEEHNPVVIYIEDDLEYAVAARFFSEHFLHPKTAN